jgi:sulfite reductase alpha subunit-like flavoprotein
MEEKEKRRGGELLILVGTQTGTAEELGGRLAFVARKHGLTARLLPFDQYDVVLAPLIKDFKMIKILLFIVLYLHIAVVVHHK